LYVCSSLYSNSIKLTPWSFPYLVVISCMSMNFLFSSLPQDIQSVILFLICECKSKKYLPNHQNFFEVFFINLEIVSMYSSNLSCAPILSFGTAKII